MERSRKLALALEIILGLLPVTCTLLPLLAVGGFLVAYSMATKLLDLSVPLASRLQSAGSPLPLLIWILAGVAGVASVWILPFISSSSLQRRPLLLRFLTIGFISGVVAAMVWFYTIAKASAWDLSTWLVWAGILAGPLTVGLRHRHKLRPPTPRSGEAIC